MTTPQQMEEEMLSNPVRSLQYMLRRLAGRYDFLPQLALDGIFGERTLEAVDALPAGVFICRSPAWWTSGPGTPSGTPGSTWSGRPRLPAPSASSRGEGHQVQPGMSGGTMVLPQTMFQLLRQRLEGIAEGEANGVHGDASVQNTLWLQNLAQLEQTRSHGPADMGICSAGCTSCLITAEPLS